jgi:hypothetical protein
MAYVFERAVLPEESELEPAGSWMLAPVRLELRHEASGSTAAVTLSVPVPAAEDMDALHKAAMAEAEELARTVAQHLEETDTQSLAGFFQGE